MTTRRNVIVVGLTAVSLTMVPAAWASHSRPHFTGHDRTVTVTCTGVPPFVADANALFGQQTQAAAFNAAPPESVCVVQLNQP